MDIYIYIYIFTWENYKSCVYIYNDDIWFGNNYLKLLVLLFKRGGERHLGAK